MRLNWAAQLHHLIAWSHLGERRQRSPGGRERWDCPEVGPSVVEELLKIFP